MAIKISKSALAYDPEKEKKAKSNTLKDKLVYDPEKAKAAQLQTRKTQLSSIANVGNTVLDNNTAGNVKGTTGLAKSNYDLQLEGLKANAIEQAGGNAWDEETLRLNRLQNERAKLLSYMTPMQKNQYNATEQALRDSYVEGIRNELNEKLGLDYAKEVLAEKDAGNRFAKTTALGASSGFSAFGSGIKGAYNALTDDGSKIATRGASEYAFNAVRPELEGLEMVMADLGRTFGNMAPSVAASIFAGPLGKVVGPVTMGISSGGNSYDEAIRDGYDKGKALAYGTAIGATEAGLQALLGSIPGINKGSSVVTKLLSKYSDDALALAVKNPNARRLITSVLGNSLSEGAEESAQNVLDVLFRNLILGEQNKVDLAEMSYEGFIGWLFSFLTNMPGSVSTYLGSRGTNIEAPAAVTEENKAPEVKAPEVKTEEAPITEKTKKTVKAVNPEAANSQQILRDIMRNNGYGKLLDTIDSVANKFNVEVRLYADNTNSEGWYENGVVGLNISNLRNTEDGVWKVIKHELTHFIEGTEGYGELLSSIEGVTAFNDYFNKANYSYKTADGEELTGYAAFKEIIKERYAANGVNLTPTQVQQEAFAKFIEESDIFTSEESIKRLAAESPNLAQRILQWIKDAIAKLTGTADTRRLMALEKTYEKALGQAAKGEYLYNRNGSKEYLFIKERDANAIRKAEADEMAGYNADDIWYRKGLKRDSRGNWITEIDDSQAKFDASGVKTSGKLSDVLTHDALYSIYPDAANINFEFKTMPTGMNGRYTPNTKTITLNSKFRNPALADSAKSTLIHEIQHYLQVVEDRSVGGSRGSVYTYLMNQFYAKYSNNKSFQGLKDYFAKKRYLEDKIKKAYGGKSLENILKEQYRAIEGEEEARAAAYRKDLDAAERRYDYPKYGGNGIDLTDTENYNEFVTRDTNSIAMGRQTVSPVIANLHKQLGGRMYDEAGIHNNDTNTGLGRGSVTVQDVLTEVGAMDRSKNNDQVFGETSSRSTQALQNEQTAEVGAQKYNRDSALPNKSRINNEGQAGNGLFFNAEKQYSFSEDNNGRKLSAEQQEYFKDSKVRDEEGRLITVYHGSRQGGFTVFNRNLNYYTNNKDMAGSYSPKGDMYEGYLDIKKPFVVDAKNDKWSGIAIDKETKDLIQAYGGSVFKEKGAWRTTPADIASTISDAVDEGELDYDGVIVLNVDDTGMYYKTKGKNIGNDYITFKSNQFKNVDNTRPTSDPDIRYSFKEETSKVADAPETKDVIRDLKMQKQQSRYGTRNYAAYTENRIEAELKESMSNSAPDYAKSYIAWVDPLDYLYATTGSAATRNTIKQEAGKLDVEKLKAEEQPIYLIVDAKTNEIVGHEGRHRMTALSEAGIDKVAVVIKMTNQGDTKQLYPTKYLDVEGQQFSEYSKGLSFTISDLLPLSKRYADTAREMFSDIESKNGNIQFSMKEDRQLNKKSEQYLHRATNTLLNDFLEITEANKYADVRSIKKDINTFAEASAKRGSVDREEANKLFDVLFSEALVKDAEVAERYGEAAEKIKATKFYGGGLGSLEGRYRRDYFGKVRLVTDPAATKIDSFYKELSENHPDIVDPDITNIEDQVQALANVVDEANNSLKHLNEFMGNYTERAEKAREAFMASLDNFEASIGDVSRYTDSREAKEAIKADRAQKVEDIRNDKEYAKSFFKEYTEARRAYDKLARKEMLTPEDTLIMKQLSDGLITWEEVEKREGEFNVKAIKKVYDAFNAKYEFDKVAGQLRTKVVGEYRQLAEDEAVNSDEWKDKKAGALYSRETMERNIEDITRKANGKNRRNVDAEMINKTYFKPVHENEAKSNRLKKELVEKIKALKLDTDKKYTVMFENEQTGTPVQAQVSESGLVQLYGEKLIDDKILESVGADVGKVQNAVKEFRSIYNELIELANDTLIRNGYRPVEYRKDYFPHFTENKADSLLGEIAGYFGIDIKTDELPTDIAGITHTFKPGKKWVGNFLERKTNVTDYDALKGFDRYLNGASDVIFHTDDIQRLRAFESELRYKYSDEGTRKRIREIENNDALTAEQKQSLIEDIMKVNEVSHLPNLVTELRNYTDNLAGKKSISDRNWEHAMGRSFYNFMKKMEGRVSANMVALNPGSWLTNFIPITQVSGIVSNKNLARAVWDASKSFVNSDGFADRSDFLVNRKGSELTFKTKADKIQEKLTKPFEIIDSFSADVVTRALYYDQMAKTGNEVEALDYANDMAARVMADRSKGAKPTAFNSQNPVAKLVTMFQIEVNNQYSYLFKDLPAAEREKGKAALVAALVKVFLGAYLYNELYEKVVGRRAALDPADIIATAYKDFKDPNVKSSQAIANTAKNIADELPFVGSLLGGGRIPIQSALPDIGNLSEAATGLLTGEMNSNKAMQQLGKELIKPMAYLVPPVGGGQLKKAYDCC